MFWLRVFLKKSYIFQCLKAMVDFFIRLNLNNNGDKFLNFIKYLYDLKRKLDNYIEKKMDKYNFKNSIS